MDAPAVRPYHVYTDQPFSTATQVHDEETKKEHYTDCPVEEFQEG